jgi:spore maturation protein CgeB
MAAYDLSGYDGVLAFGAALADVYARQGWGARAFVWHEAADARLFHPPSNKMQRRGIVWIGNWGDDERTVELQEFLVEPVARLRLSARVHGVRYPREARRTLHEAGIEFAGYLANFRAADEFAAARATVHIPRRPYVRMLPGIPTIRVFEALACGIPLVCAPWDDAEGLFTAGDDFLLARNGDEMRRHLCAILHDPGLAAELSRHGRATIEARHNCAHRVDELLAICRTLGQDLCSPQIAAAQ